MRLLHTREFSFKFFPRTPPDYAILSHRWTDTESSIQDVQRGSLSHKIHGFADFVNSYLDIEWIWVDSCCIDQKSTAELSEGVNCMFEWYRDAKICIAYLADVKHPEDQLAFRKAEWFTRGWTLQELVASTVVVFVTDKWEIIGHKGRTSHFGRLEFGPNLESMISEVTEIPSAVLQDFSKSYSLSIEQRMHWMDGRKTLKEEDLSYALFGIFGVTPGANYGEKKSGAARRLKKAIAEKEHPSDSLSTQSEPSSKRHASFSDHAQTRTPFHHSLPFTRDSKFVERNAMVLLRDKLHPGDRVAIVGLGGVGKSQVAIEHCYRTINASTMSVLWLHASNATRFDQEVTRLVQDLKIPGCHEKNANFLQLFRDWLLDVNRRWLLVLDNADDADFLLEAPEIDKTRARFDYIPVCTHGSVMVTSRRQAMARKLQLETILLEPEQELGIELLRSKLGTSKVTADVTELAKALDYIPLAIAQAAAYIQQRGSRSSIEDYIAKLQKSERSKSSLLKVRSDELRRDRQEAENSILLTWQISFDHIRAVRQSAADLLAVMSFYDNQGIPESLLKGHTTIEDEVGEDSNQASQDEPEQNSDTAPQDDAEERSGSAAQDDTRENSDNATQDGGNFRTTENSDSISSDNTECQSEENSDKASQSDLDIAFEDDIMLLCDYSFISVTTDSSIFQMHRLVQLAAQVWLRENTDQYERYQAQSLRNLDDAYPHPDFELWDICRTLQIHAKHFYDTRVKDDVAGLSLASIMYKAAWFAEDQGLYAEAEIMSQRSLHGHKRILGADHPHTLTSMGMLASTFERQGRVNEAEELNVERLEISRRVLGQEHPSTLTSMNNLASTYMRQGRWKEAEELHFEVLEIRTRVLGQEHPDTRSSMNNLASTYQKQGRLAEAEALQIEVQNIRKRILGSEHPDTLRSMNNLAVTYHDQRRLQDALDLMQECVRLRVIVLGATHPNTVGSIGWVEYIEDAMKKAASNEAQSGGASLVVTDAD